MRLSPRQSLAAILSAITVTATLTLAFAPITLFFMITAQSYPFFIPLNTAILTLTGSVGLSFLIGGMRLMNAQARAEQNLKSEVDVLPAQFDRLIGLGVVGLVALDAVLVLLRSGGRAGQGRSRALGYPPELLPAQHLTRAGALATLAATQARLAAILGRCRRRATYRSG